MRRRQGLRDSKNDKWLGEFTKVGVGGEREA